MALPRYPLQRQIYILSLGEGLFSRSKLAPLLHILMRQYDTVIAHFAHSELAELGLGKSLAESARGIALFCNQKHSPSLWNVLARQSVLGRLIKHSCEAAAVCRLILLL